MTHSSGTRSAAVLGALLATLWGRPAEAERRAQRGRARELRRRPARRQRFDRLLAGPPARAPLSARSGEDARGRGARARAPRTRQPRPAARIAAPRRLAVAGRRARPGRRPLRRRRRGRPRTGNGRGGRRRRSASAPPIAIGRDAWVQAEELANQALASIRRSRMEDYPTSALVYAVAARVALQPRRSPARRRAPHQGAAASAPAHLRDAVDLGPDAPGARPRLPHDGRRRRRRDDAPRDRRAAAPATGPRHPPRRGAGAALEPADDAAHRPPVPRR